MKKKKPKNIKPQRFAKPLEDYVQQNISSNQVLAGHVHVVKPQR